MRAVEFFSFKMVENCVKPEPENEEKMPYGCMQLDVVTLTIQRCF